MLKLQMYVLIVLGIDKSTQIIDYK